MGDNNDIMVMGVDDIFENDIIIKFDEVSFYNKLFVDLSFILFMFYLFVRMYVCPILEFPNYCIT